MKKSNIAFFMTFTLCLTQLTPIIVHATELENLNDSAQVKLDNESTNDESQTETNPISSESETTEAEISKESAASKEASQDESTEAKPIPMEEQVGLKAAGVKDSGISGTANWVLYDDGLLEISGGELDYSKPWDTYIDEITSVVIENVVASDDLSGFFFGYQALENVQFTNFDTSNVIEMSDMFSGCGALKSIDLSSLETGNVENMSFMFSECTSLEDVNFSSFDTSHVIYMFSMFHGCSSIESIDLSSFDTENVNDMNDMFSECTSLKSLDLSSFDTRNVIVMDYMFLGCTALEKLNLSSFDTRNVSVVSMFEDCNRLFELTLGEYFILGGDDEQPDNQLENELPELSDGFFWIDDTETLVKTSEELFDYHESYGQINTYRVGKPVRVEYVDGDGTEIHLPSLFYAYLIEGTYDATSPEYQLTIDGYQLDESKFPANAQGNIDSEDQVITYVYQKIVPAAEVIVKYVDQDGNEIAPEKTITGNLEDSYDVTTPEYKILIAGYLLDETKLPANAQGTFSDRIQVITYVYQKIEESITPTPTDPDAGVGTEAGNSSNNNNGDQTNHQINTETNQNEATVSKEAALPKTGANRFSAVMSVALGSLFVVASTLMLKRHKKIVK